MIASVMCQRTVQQCLDEIGGMYINKPITTCAISDNGFKHAFVGPNDLASMNNCVELPGGIKICLVFL